MAIEKALSDAGSFEEKTLATEWHMRYTISLISLVCWFVVLSASSTAQSARADHKARVPQRQIEARELAFAARTEILTGEQPTGIASGDWNHDGALDLVVVNRSGGFPAEDETVSVLVGRGDGKFVTAPEVVLGKSLSPVAVVAGDFDEDTHLDLAVANQLGNSVSIAKGAGDGTFQATVAIAVATRPVGLAAADFNDDTLLDLAVISARLASPFQFPEPGVISILLGQGNGTFQPGPPTLVGTNATSLAVADFDSDRRADVAVVAGSPRSVTLLRGQGDGTFQTSSTISVSGAQFAAVGDFDRDRRVDLAIVGEVFPQGLASILLGRGDGTFQSMPSVLVGERPSAVTVGDFNRDRRPDVLVTNRLADTVSIAIGVGDGTLTVGPALMVGSTPIGIVFGDFDADRRVDLATANQAGTVSIVMARGHESFDVAPTYGVGVCCPSSLVIGDFNNDGERDLATPNFPDGTVSVLLGLGQAQFQPMAPFEVPDFPWELAAADFNGDGRLDLAMTNPGIGGGGNTISIVLNQSGGTFAAAPQVLVGSVPVAIVSSDFNDDGRADLAVTNDFGNSVSVLLGLGDGTFQRTQDLAVGRNPLAMVLGDVNGDAQLDLIVANTNQNPFSEPGSVSILLGTGSGTFQATKEVPVGVRPISVAAADLNRDGRLDLAVVNQFGDPPVSILFGNGDGAFEAGPDVDVPGHRVVIADFNHDRLLDLAILNISNYVSIVPGAADGTFTTALLVGVGGGPEFLLQEDFDGDGRPDLATADYQSMSVSILMNNSKKRKPS